MKDRAIDKSKGERNLEPIHRRIVSKREYLQVQSLRFAFTVSSLSFLMLSLCGRIGLLLLVALFTLLIECFSGSCMFCSLVVDTIEKTNEQYKRIKRTNSLRNVTLLTRANSAEILAADILVRASDKPNQEHQDILLRAVVDPQDTPVEQLLRPVDEGAPEANMLMNWRKA